MTVLHQVAGDVFHALPRLPDNWAHGMIADPPFGWSMMQRAWDSAHLHHQDERWRRLAGWRGDKKLSRGEKYVLWCLGWLSEIYRIVVPGSNVVIKSGSRSYHRLVFAAELAGFQVLPMFVQIVGSSMAQGQDISKAVDKAAGAEREVVGTYDSPEGTTGWKNQDAPSVTLRLASAESGRRRDITAPATAMAQAASGYHTRARDMLIPWAMLRRPFAGPAARSVARWGVGGYNVDGCRIETGPEGREKKLSVNGAAVSNSVSSQGHGSITGSKHAGSTRLGRYPGNLLIDQAAAAEIGRQSGELASHGGGRRLNAGAKGGGYSGGYGGMPDYKIPAGDSGTTARFFFRYSSRASGEERLRGLEHWHWIGDPDHPEGWRRISTAEALAQEPRKRVSGCSHPTLTPLEVCRYLARLILPPPPRGIMPADPYAELQPFHDEQGRYRGQHVVEPLNRSLEEVRVATTGSRGRVLVPFSGVLSEAIGCALAGWPEIVAIESSAGRDGYVAQGACRWVGWGPYSGQRAAALAEVGGVAKEEHHGGQGRLW